MTRNPVILMAMASVGLLQGQPVPADLYLAPDIQSFKIDSASLDDPRLSQAMPVENEAKALLGWQTATFTGSVVGYVPDSKIGKDLLPVNDTPIRVAPGGDSPAIGAYQFGDSIDVLDTGIWWKVNVETAFPVYFIADSPQPVALPDAPEDREVEIYPSGIEDDTTVFDAPIEPEAEPAAPVSILDRTPEPRVGIVSRSYTGKLERAKKGIGPFRPKAPFELVNAKGKRLVWVNFGEIIMPGTVRSYIGREVLLLGEPVQDEKSGQWIVYVRTIQENP